MKAITPWVSFRMIDGPEGDSGFFMSLAPIWIAGRTACDAG